MHKLKVVLCSAFISVAALASASVAYAENAERAVQPVADVGTQAPSSAADTVEALAASADPYDVKNFFADFTHFSIGDTAPELYRSKQYEVSQWNVRHLPAPVADSHWTYMGGNYVMITNADGKILKAESGDIYYKH